MEDIDELDRFLTDLMGEPPVRLTPEEVLKYTHMAVDTGNNKNSIYLSNEKEIAAIYTESLGMAG
jgi:hypothetical protein